MPLPLRFRIAPKNQKARLPECLGRGLAPTDVSSPSRRWTPPSAQTPRIRIALSAKFARPTASRRD